LSFPGVVHHAITVCGSSLKDLWWAQQT